SPGCWCTSRRRHTRFSRDWSSDVCCSDLAAARPPRRSETGSRASPPRPRKTRAQSAYMPCSDECDPKAQTEKESRATSAKRRVRSEERRVGKESRWRREAVGETEQEHSYQ